MGDMPPAIVLTAYGNVETAVRTVHELGAYWYVEKPIQPNVLQVLLRRAAAQSGCATRRRRSERNLHTRARWAKWWANPAACRRFSLCCSRPRPAKRASSLRAKAAPAKKWWRARSTAQPAAGGPFVAINCAALPETLIESELFGHEKGSFTGASERRAGCFELAQHGTLLLDEIGEMPMPTQAKLLRILEDSKVRRLGGKAEFEVDVRLVAATNKVPDEACAAAICARICSTG